MWEDTPLPTLEHPTAALYYSLHIFFPFSKIANMLKILKVCEEIVSKEGWTRNQYRSMHNTNHFIHIWYWNQLALPCYQAP